MKTRLIRCLSVGVMLVANSGLAQELPVPDSLYVATRCHVNDGATFQEAVEEGRSRQNANDGPNQIFYRQPIAGNDAAPNQFTRVVSWDNMQHWASSGGPSGSQTMTCDNQNRRFLTTRNIGNNRTAYSGSSDRSSLVSTRQCTLTTGATISDAYQFLTEIQTSREVQGDTSQMQLSHLFLGPSIETEMRSRIIVRLIGELAVGLARTFDSVNEGNVAIGTPARGSAQHCQDPTLTRSYMILQNN